jgi:hypothetical protein
MAENFLLQRLGLQRPTMAGMNYGPGLGNAVNGLAGRLQNLPHAPVGSPIMSGPVAAPVARPMAGGNPQQNRLTQLLAMMRNRPRGVA